MTEQKPYLNLGCGTIILPAERPAHHSLVNPAIYDYPLWVNADRNQQPGVDECVDLFAYPWPWADNSFDAALLSHLVEHIPHEVRSANGQPPAQYQDGWFAFMSELWRVLTPGAIAHIVSPYGWTQGAITDPTHTRLITEQTFVHSMEPNPGAPFHYATGGLHFQLVGEQMFSISEYFSHLTDDHTEFMRALRTRINVVHDIYVQLEAVK